MLIFLYFDTIDYVSAQPSGKMTSKCTPDGDCVTMLCVSDYPCETIVSNSSNSTELGNIIEDKTRAILISREVA